MPLCTGVVSVTTFGIARHGDRLVSTLTGHEDFVNSVAYSPNGQLLASGSDDGTVRIWDTRTGQEAATALSIADGRVKSVAFAPDGQHIVVGGEGNAIYVWNVTTGCAALPPLRGHSNAIQSVAFSPNGRLIASASEDKTTRLWSAETGREISVMHGHTDQIRAIAFSPDGQLLASASDDNTVRIWTSHTGDEAGNSLTGLKEAVTCICFSSDSKYLAAGAGGAARAGLWDMETRESTPLQIDIYSGVGSLAFSSDGSRLFVAQHNCIQSWDPKTGREIPGSSLDGHSKWIRSIAFSPDGLFLASGGCDNTIRIWDAVRGGDEVVQPLQAHGSSVTSVAVSSAGTFIVSGSHDHSICVWDAITGEARLPPLLEHSDGVLAVAISPNGCFIASASVDHTVILWDAQTGIAVGEPLQDHEDSVLAVDFSPDSLWLASGSSDNTVRVWDIATRQVTPFGLLQCTEFVSAVAFSPDGRLLAASYDGSIHLWLSGSDQQARAPLQPNDRRIRSVAFSPDASRLLSGSYIGPVRVWDVETGHQVFEIEGWASAVAYSPNGQYVVVASDFNHLCLSDAETGATVSVLNGHYDNPSSAVFTPDGRSIISGARDGTVRIWDVEAAVSLPLQAEHDPLARLGSTHVRHDGWLMGSSGELLLWLPADYRSYIQLPPCSTVIGSCRVVLTADEGLHWGDQWTACWQSSGCPMTGTSL